METTGICVYEFCIELVFLFILCIRDFKRLFRTVCKCYRLKFVVGHSRNVDAISGLDIVCIVSFFRYWILILCGSCYFALSFRMHNLSVLFLNENMLRCGIWHNISFRYLTTKVVKYVVL